MDEDVGLRPARVVAAQLRGRFEQLLCPGDDVGRRVAALPDRDARRRRASGSGAKAFRGLRRSFTRGSSEHDREAAVVEPRNQVELARRPHQPAERLVGVPARNAQEHEGERLVVLARRRSEPPQLVVQVRLVVDPGERVAARRLAGGADEQYPAAQEQQRRQSEDEEDRGGGGLALGTLDDENGQDHEQRGGHARRRVDPERRAALRPVRPASDPERGRDGSEADQARLQLPAEVDQTTRDVVAVNDEIGVDAVGDATGGHARGDEPPRQRPPPRGDERRGRDRGDDDEVEHGVAEPDDGSEVCPQPEVAEDEPPPDEAERGDHQHAVQERLAADHSQGRPEEEDERRQHQDVEAEVAQVGPPGERDHAIAQLDDAPRDLTAEPAGAGERDEQPEALQPARDAGRGPRREDHGGSDRDDVGGVGEDEQGVLPTRREQEPARIEGEPGCDYGDCAGSRMPCAGRSHRTRHRAVRRVLRPPFGG